MTGIVIKSISTPLALEILDRVPLFQALKQEEKKLIVAIPELFQMIPQHDTFIKVGDDDQNIYILLYGEAVVLRRQTMLGRIDPGDFVGEVGFMLREKRTASVQALSDLIVLKINAERFHKLPIKIREIIKDRIIQGLASRVEKQNKELMKYRSLLDKQNLFSAAYGDTPDSELPAGSP